ncbi:MAG TPA: oxidoreductase [Lacisediminihabitans sp.]|uniref:oxidoreductase n=1 Tax=Lacisediminihabitans sp. TaxID=2787631 RepID=UPI002ED9A5E1
MTRNNVNSRHDGHQVSAEGTGIMATWLITGTSSGLGRALAEQALAAGGQVVATARDPQTIRDLEDAHPDTAAAVRLDVTDRTSIAAAVDTAQARFGDIDVLVNNAGYGYTAAIEEGEDDAVAELFATNFTGPVALINAVLPGMRSRGSGLIVNVSSVGVKLTLPGGGYYSAAKAALEAASGALRKEVAALGIHVMVVEPGSMRTDFRGRSARRSEIRIGDYDEILGRTGEGRLGPQRGDPVKAARAILTATTEPVPPALLLLGSDALTDYRTLTQAEQADVDRHEPLTLSTDATT